MTDYDRRAFDQLLREERRNRRRESDEFSLRPALAFSAFLGMCCVLWHLLGALGVTS